MSKSGRRLLILLTLALWVVSGPIGMAPLIAREGVDAVRGRTCCV